MTEGRDESGLSVLMITERFAPDIGGLARSSARVAGALARLGARVDVVTWTRQLPPGAVEMREESPAEVPGVCVHRVGLFANCDMSLQHTMNVLEWLHERRRFGAVWGHYLFPAGFAAVMFAKTAGIPVTVSARGNDVDRLMFPPGDFARLLWTLERADVVTAVSRDLARKIDVLLGRDARVEVIRNAVDVATFSPAAPPAGLRERLGIAAEEAVLGFSGELRHKKGVDFMLSALREVRRSRPACLLIIGEARAEEEAKLASFGEECPEDARRIIITGHIAEPARVAEHLRLCDLFLQPSLWDGMPNALLEAMACGRVVIGSDAGGIPEAIEHGVSGFILPKPQLNCLGAAALEALTMGEAERAAMQRAARARIERDFQPAAEAVGLRRVLERLRPKTSS